MAAPSPYASTCSSLSARCLERAPTVTLATFTRSFERCHALLLGIGRSMQANSLLADARVRPACAAPRFARAWIDACMHKCVHGVCARRVRTPCVHGECARRVRTPCVHGVYARRNARYDVRRDT
eukprot:scaffold52782_cov38-Phaeocystis_antarctica.AAC.1